MNGRSLAAIASIACWLVLAGSARGEENRSITRVREDLGAFLREGAQSTEAKLVLPKLSSFDVASDAKGDAFHTILTTRAARPFYGRVPVTVALYEGERLVRRAVVTPVVKTMRSIVTASRDLAKGEVLSASDLATRRVDESKAARDAVALRDDAIGKRMRRRVRRGQSIRSSQIESIPLVERGDRVTVLLQSGGLTIQAIGRAQEKGAAGEMIRVLNLDSKREISGRLDRQGAVRVAF